jgi:hypothetical protein
VFETVRGNVRNSDRREIRNDWVRMVVCVYVEVRIINVGMSWNSADIKNVM